MASPTPPRRRTDIDREWTSEESGSSIADIVAEDIEAGYDIQSDAATKPLASDHASSSESDE